MEAFTDHIPEKEPPNSLQYFVLAERLFHSLSQFICLFAFCFGPLVECKFLEVRSAVHLIDQCILVPGGVPGTLNKYCWINEYILGQE